MAKSEVYSWRLSPEVKRSLEDEARRRSVTLAEMLDQIAHEFLSRRTRTDDAQDRVRAATRRWIGSISGGGARRSERVRDLVRDQLNAKLRDRRPR
jgi:hypothetical protein